MCSKVGLWLGVVVRGEIPGSSEVLSGLPGLPCRIARLGPRDDVRSLDDMLAEI